jgi:hypothetical protein
VYVDDFLIIAETKEECQAALRSLIAVLRSLGFRIAWNKVVDPTQCLTFLGIELDSVAGTASLNPEKRTHLTQLLQSLLTKKRLSKKQLQRLAGKLSWAATVIPWGRLHVRSIFDLIAALKCDNHKCPIRAVTPDLHWWLTFLAKPSYCRRLWDSRPITNIHCDASQTAGGAFCLNDWLYTAWSADLPALAEDHINIKELAMAVAAIFHWAPQLSDHRVLIVTDNSATQAILNKGTSPSLAAANLLRYLSALTVHFDIGVSAIHIPGCDNHIPDAISRLHSPGQLQRLGALLRSQSLPPSILSNHMSQASLSFLLSQVFLPQVRRSPPPFMT